MQSSLTLLLADAEVKAVQVMAAAIRENPQSYTILHAQCDLLVTKGRIDWAVQLAKQAVNCAPSEFSTWAKLTELYTEMGNYDAALLTLNSCPMFTYNDRDLHRMPTTSKTHLPIKQFIADSRILDDYAPSDHEADPALLRLPAPALRGTFARAYSLLAKLVSQIGWDELLKTRSTVFVMEEEYRQQKVQADMRSAGPDQQSHNPNGAIHEDGTVGSPHTSTNGNANGNGGSLPAPDADDNASTRAIVDRSSTDAPATPDVEKPVITDEFDEDSNVSSVEDADFAEQVQANGVKKEEEEDEMKTTDLERPGVAVMNEEEDSKNSPPQDYSFSNKRLCERWLDNLFMVLYEVRLCCPPASLRFTLIMASLVSKCNLGSPRVDDIPRRSRPL